MATTSTDPRDIEADLERERAALADTLDTLSDRVSVDNLAKEALGMLKSQAGSATSSLDHVVRANPIAVALIGAGIAWMFLGPKGRSSSSSSSDADVADVYVSREAEASGYVGSAPPSYGSSSSTYGRSPYAGGNTGSYGSYTGSTASTYAGGTSPSYAAGADYGRVGYVASDNDEEHAWSREAHGLRARASEALHRIEQEAKEYYDSLRRGISNLTSGSRERDFEAERQGVISRFTSDLKERFSAGLDNLPPEARERVIAARQRAYGAMLQAERMGQEAWRNPGRTMEEHPFVAGAVAFALGSAVAALLPSTEVENRTLGAERDRLMNDAARLLREERERAKQLAGSLSQEIKSAAQETVGAVTETVSQKASQAASRVGERTEEEVRNASSNSSTSSTASASTAGSTSTSTSTSGTTGSGTGGTAGSSTSGLTGPGDPVIR